MTSKIRVLPDATINQIAAGEVIESPASVVKELVENSLDAGAKKILVEIQGGGLNLIRISDDGSGMNKDDAILCLERHATSKIQDAKDLFKIQTMGFRGEALASIASISKMTLTTSLGEIGLQLEVDAGKIKSVDPYPRNKGTTIEVRYLFFNVPARKKFQKSASSCASEITRALTHLSIGYPDVSFELYNQDALVFSSAALESTEFLEKLKRRVFDTLGISFSSSVIHVHEEEGPFVLKGLIGMPENTRHNRTGQYLYINQRSIVSPLISYAIRDAYGTRVAADRHPVYVLHIEMPYHLLDVNVHPQKKEVRLSEEGWIKRLIQKAIQRSLDRPASVGQTIAPAIAFSDFPFEEPQESQMERKEAPVPFMYREQSILPAENEPKLNLFREKLQVIGLWSPYLFLEASSIKDRISLPMEEEGVCIIDLPAAKSRVLFERLLKAKEEPCHKQGLMFPLSFELPLAEAQELVRSYPYLQSIGFSVEQVGPRAFIVDAIPSYLEEGDVQDIIHQMISESISLDNEDIESLEMKKRRQLAEIASRFVRSKKNTYLLSEAMALVEELCKTSSPCHCPQGFKTIAYLSTKDVGSYFSAKER